jgi:hypothetical protein
MAETFIMHRFESIHEFVDAAAKGAEKTGASHATEGSAGRYQKNWHGTKSFGEAVNFAKNGGWDPGTLLEFRDMFEELLPRLRKFTDLEWERASDQHGYEVNMQAYLDGDPDHMYEWVPSEHMVTKRALCLIIGHSISGGCSAEDLFIRGQAAVALVRALSLLGFELEIWSEETVGGYGGHFSTLVRLHAAGEILDESAIEFAIGNPSWLRRLLFGFQEGQPQDIRQKYGFTKNGGYGSCTPIKHADLVGADIQLDLGQSWFSTWDRKSVAEDGMRWVVEQLKKLGVVDADAEWEDD